jgi:spermidine synthase
VITTDAYTFLSLTENMYDMICMDVFIDDAVPQELETKDFLEMLKETLTDEGLLIYNRLSLTGKDIEDTERFYNEVFIKVFTQASIFDAGGNKMLLNRPLN